MTDYLTSLREAHDVLGDAQEDAPLGTALMIAERRQQLRDLIERIERSNDGNTSR